MSAHPKRLLAGRRGKLLTAIGVALVVTGGALAYFTTPGSGAGTVSVATITSPAPVTVTSPTNGTAHVSWSQVTLSPDDPTADRDVTYTVQRKVSSANDSTYVYVCGTGTTPEAYNATSCDDTVITTNTYTYKLTAAFRSWTSTAVSSPTLIQAIPDAPTAVSMINGHNGYINGSNQTSVSIDVSLPSSSTLGDTVHLTLGNGTTTVTPPTQTASGGTATTHFTGIDASLFADGTVITLTAWTSNSGGPSSNATTTVFKDTVAPTATIALESGSDTGSSSSDNITNATSLGFDVTFSEPVSGLTAGNFSNVGTAAGCSFGSLSGSGSSYTITATGCSEGTVKARLAANAVGDTAGNQTPQTDGAAVTVDRTPQTATITLQAASDTGYSNSDNITKAASLVFSVTFSESVTGVSAGSFSKGNGTATGCSFGSLTGSGSAYTITATGCSEGTLALRLAAAAVTDTAGNTNAQTDGSTITIDRTAPTVTIALQPSSDTGISNSDNITNAPSPVFNVTFSENVSGITAGSFSKGSGTATACSFGSLTSLTSSSYTITGNSCSEGTLVVRVAAAAATDAAGNTSAQTDGSTVTIDRTRPTVTISLQPASDTGTSNSDNITNASSPVFNINFSENVSGPAAANFSNQGNATGCTFGAAVGGPQNYTETVTGCSGGTVIVRLAQNGVTDTAGNGNAQTDGSTLTIDRTAPTVTISLQGGSDTGTSNSDNNTNAASLTFDVNFSETVSGLAAGDFSKGSGTATGCSFGSLTGSGSAYTITATGCSEGTLAVRIAAAAVTDTAGNANARTTGSTVTIDRTGPTATTLQFFDTDKNGKIDQIKATFNETLGSYTAGTAPWTLANAPTGVSIASVSVTGAVATLTLNEGSGLDTAAAGMTLAMAVNPNGVSDLAGNQGSFAAATVADKAAPVPVAITSTNATGGTAGQADAGDTITVTFSEPLAAFGPSTSTVTLSTSNGANKAVKLNMTGLDSGPFQIGTKNDYLTGNGRTSAIFGPSNSILAESSSNQVMVTLGTWDGNGALSVGSSQSVTFTPAATVTDPAGNAATGSLTTTILFF